MSGLLNNSLFLSTAAAAAGGYQIQRSLRFNSSDSAYLSRTPAVAGSRTTWTWAAWVKRTKLDGEMVFFSCYTGGTTLLECNFTTANRINLGTWFTQLRLTTQVFRDVSAWFHFVVVMDTNNGTPADRIRIYINGARVTDFNAATDPSPGDTFAIDSTSVHYIGKSDPSGSGYNFNGYLADIHFISGQALDATAFTEVSATTGQLLPRQYTGSFGTNGFWLKFSDNSAATAATLGKDYSGNSNNWTPNNLEVGSSYYSSGGNNALLTSGSFQDLFDPSLITGAYVSTSGSGTTVRYTFPNAVSGSIRFYGSNYAGAANNTANCATITLSTGQTYDFGPNSYSNPNWSTTWTVSNLQWVDLFGRNIPGNSDGLLLRAVELNGMLLTDSRYSDSLVDTPTSTGTDTGVGNEVRGNYCTWNPLAKGSNTTLSNGNLDMSSGATWQSVVATLGATSGKWYWEQTMTTNQYSYTGICNQKFLGNVNSNWPGQTTNSWSYLTSHGLAQNDQGGGAEVSVTLTTMASGGGTLGFALDLDNQKLWFSLNGVWMGSGSPNPATGTAAAFTNLVSGDTYFPCADVYEASAVFNFGQRAFAYTAPSGFKALCDTNLPSPVVAKPNTVFDIITYTGTGATQTLPNANSTPSTPLAFSPDLVWIKCRSVARNHALQDTVRGALQWLGSNLTNAESTDAGSITSFNSDGFTLGNATGYNQSGETHVAWAWDAGTTTASNGSGSITSQVRANASAGFSVVTYTGNGSAGATIGHGLGVAPAFLIIKGRGHVSSWHCYHSAIGNTSAIFLSSTSASVANSVYWNNTSPGSTTFTVGTSDGMNGNTNTYVAYCFSSVVGYSSFGSYTGNGSADGPFVYTGFRPRWVMYKVYSGDTGHWWIHDTSRDPYNEARNALYANLSNSENTNAHRLDILSNGYKIRSSDININGSGFGFIYIAFAENPFQYARAR